MRPNAIKKGSKFPFGEYVEDGGYMLLYGQQDFFIRGGREWTKELHLPEWHFTTEDFAESIDTLGEVNDEKYFMVCNQYIRPANYIEPKQKPAGGRKKKAVAFDTNPGETPESVEL